MLSLWARGGLGAMAMKEYSAFPKAPAFPQSSSINGTSPSDCLVSYSGHLFEDRGSHIPQQRPSQCILRPQQRVSRVIYVNHPE